jgi:MoxR-like ATPase
MADVGRRPARAGLILAAKARAMLAGQFYVSCDDVAAMALPIFRRIIERRAERRVTSDDITRKVLESVPKHEKL